MSPLPRALETMLNLLMIRAVKQCRSESQPDTVDLRIVALEYGMVA